MFQSPGWAGRRLRAPSILRCSILLVAGGLLMGVFWGCGRAEYQRRLDARLEKEKEKERAAARFNMLYQSQALEGVPVSVRIPTVFTSAPMIEGRGQADPRRVKPGIVTLPSLKLTYEMTIKNEKGQLPYYCYVGAAKAAEEQFDKDRETLRAELTAKPGAQVSDWEDFKGESPDGRQIDWKKLRCVTQQEFTYNDANGQARSDNMPGLLEIYLREEKGYLVVIAWRMPTSLETQVNLAQWAPLVAGCVSVGP
jgi:hypothetical protein